MFLENFDGEDNLPNMGFTSTLIFSCKRVSHTKPVVSVFSTLLFSEGLIFGDETVNCMEWRGWGM